MLKSCLGGRTLGSIADDSSIEDSYHLIAADVSLEDPMPVLIANPKGGPKSTISLPQHLTYPLKPSEYSTVCSRHEDVARRLRHQNSRSEVYQNRGFQDYYWFDPNFMDINEAEEYGLLPVKQDSATPLSQRTSDAAHRKLSEGEPSVKHSGTNNKICEKSLTYVLETADAGIGKTLMGLWLSYGLAKKEGRAFFIDDSNW